MLSANELVNDNGISSVALAFFTALFGAISVTIVGIFQVKSAAKKAKEEAEQAKLNTTNISNGFASSVEKKLNRIITEQDKLSGSLRKHLEWHLEKEE